MKEMKIRRVYADELDKLLAWRMEVLGEVFSIPSGKCAYLMNIYVRPAYRRQHIGTSVVLWLVDQARSLGISKIYLETSEMGRKMYHNLRFEEMKDMLKLHL